MLLAVELKAKFIDYILEQTQDITIGNEWTFGTNRSLVDLVLLSESSLTAVEIKSDRDRLDRLPEQIANYKLIFDFVYVLTTEKYIEKVLKMTPEDVGVIIWFYKGEFKCIRRAKKQKFLSKLEMLYSIDAHYLSSLSGFSIGKYNSDEIRKKMFKASKIKIKSVLQTYLFYKLRPGFELFMRERGMETHSEDISVFSLTNKKCVI